jgi:anti-sigma B factor antagonist
MRRRFELEHHPESDGALRATLSGELDLATVDELRDYLLEAAALGKALRLDLTELEFIDSTGLQLLLTAAADACRDGWDFTITKPSARFQRLVEVAGVADRLPIESE